jgi:type I restriction enzyme S subunit
MKDRNANRPGYKKTKAGWIPEDWNCVSLEQVAYVQTGLAKNKKKNLQNPIERPYLRVANVQDNYLDLREIKTIEVESSNIKRYLLEYGDVLFTEGGDFDKLGRGAIWRDEIDDCLHQNHIFAVRCKQNYLNRNFLAAISSSHIGRRYFSISSKQSTNLASISLTQLKEFPLPLPKLAEQNRISEILSAWDTAISRIDELITVKIEHKKAILHQILEGDGTAKRIKHDKWDDLPLGAFITPVSRPVSKPDKPYIAIGLRSHGKGTFQRVVEEPGKVAMDTLYRIKQDDIIVNITFAWEGAIAIAQENDEGGLVSHRFPTYRAKENVALSFLKQIFLTKRFVWNLGLISPGGAGRNRVLSKTDFLKLKVRIPSKVVQQKIGKILSSVDKEIKSLEEKLTSLKKQKRGLMQKLLTGEVRVKT